METILTVAGSVGLAILAYFAGLHHGVGQEKKRAQVMLSRFWMLSRFDGAGPGPLHSLARRVALREKIAARLKESRARAAASPRHR